MSLPQGFVKKDNNLIAKRKKLTDRIGAILELIGFEEGFQSALYQMSESFPKAGKDDRIKVIDSDGKILCVTDDGVTSLLQTTDGNLARLYGVSEQYKLFGNVRNETVLSAIISGVGGVEGEAEILTVALRIVEKLGIPCGKIVLGNNIVIRSAVENVVNGIVSDYDLENMLAGNAVTTETEATAANLARELAAVKGGISVIGDVAQKITNQASVDALVTLFELSKVLDEYELTDKITFDLSYLGRDYDHGTVFAVYDDADNKIVEGGRHDYMSVDGIKRSVSLRIFPDYVLSVHPEIVSEPQKLDAVIGVADGIKPLRHAYRLKNGFADAGVKCTVLYKVDKDDTHSYAEAFDVETAVYVNADGKIFYE